MNTKTENKNELIWVDEDNLKKQKLELIPITSKLNHLIIEGERVLNRLFTSEEKERVRFDGVSFIESEVKKLYKFPNATDKFNQESLGIDLTEVRKFKTMDWVPYEFYLDDDGFYQESEEQPLFDRYYYYADTDKKKKMLKMANSLVKLVEGAKAIDAIDGLHLQSMCLAFKNMVTPVYNDKGRYPIAITVYREGIALYCR